MAGYRYRAKNKNKKGANWSTKYVVGELISYLYAHKSERIDIGFQSGPCRRLIGGKHELGCKPSQVTCPSRGIIPALTFSVYCQAKVCEYGSIVLIDENVWLSRHKINKDTCTGVDQTLHHEYRREPRARYVDNSMHR